MPSCILDDNKPHYSKGQFTKPATFQSFKVDLWIQYVGKHNCHVHTEPTNTNMVKSPDDRSNETQQLFGVLFNLLLCHYNSSPERKKSEYTCRVTNCFILERDTKLSQNLEAFDCVEYVADLKILIVRQLLKEQVQPCRHVAAPYIIAL